MGILRLLPYIRQHCSHVIRSISIEDIRGRRIWVDAHGPLYRCAYATPGDTAAVVRGFLAFNTRLREAGARPVLVFDSSTPVPEKVEHCLMQRRRQRESRQMRCEAEHQELLGVLEVREERGDEDGRAEAVANLDLADLGVLGGDRHVADASPLAALPDGVALHGSDHWLR